MILNNDKRIVGVDVLKIISMLLIILQHLLFQGQIVQHYEVGTVGWILMQSLYGTTFFAVNCYALASGFLCFKQKYKISRIVLIWLQTLFYSLIIYIIFIFSNTYSFQFKDFISYCIPIITGKYWYITAYVLLFLFIPLINAAINALKRETFKIILISLTVFMVCGSVLYTVLFYKDPFSVNRGYSAMWLIVLYLFGAYLGKYEIYKTLKAKTILLLFVVLICIVIPLRLILVVKGLSRYADIFMTYVSPTNFVLALLFFVICLKIDVKNKKTRKALYALSATTLGVFLIHTHPLIRTLITPKLIVLINYNPFITFFALLVSALLVFMVCFLIDLIRIWIFKLLKVNEITEKINTKTDAN